MARVIRSRRVLTPEGVRPASVIVEGGRIAAVLAHDATTIQNRLLVPRTVDY